MSILELKNVSKIYANHTALNEVSFDVPKGKIFGLLGPNGAGKTSLIRIINQITAPDKGEVLFNGETLNQNHIKRIGYLPEERGLYKKMSVKDQIVYFARLRGMDSREAQKTMNTWLDKFEATDWKSKKIEELSKGMQQKIQFIATVMHNPELIILDEPFTGFDPKNTQLIRDEILELKKKGASIMLSTHRMENVEQICDEVVLLNNAELVATGSVNSIRTSLKQNKFELQFSGTLSPKVSDSILIEEDSELDNSRLIQFQYKKENMGLELFVNNGIKVISYQEIIPSMQDVFLTLTRTDNE